MIPLADICRLFVDPPQPGDWNMAVDEALLESTAAEHQLVLRFYQWSEPTLSLGYFQAMRDRAGHPPSVDCPAVRRQTGGGAILHDAELTYCLCVPSGHPWAANSQGLYHHVHETLIDSLLQLGVAARLCNDTRTDAAAPEPFLCFERRAVGDVLLDQAKVGGSAQRRRSGAILQHGSVLLRRSPCAPELPGIDELSGKWLSPDILASQWQEALAERLGVPMERVDSSAETLRRVDQLRLEKYAAPSWNQRR